MKAIYKKENILVEVSPCDFNKFKDGRSGKIYDREELEFDLPKKFKIKVWIGRDKSGLLCMFFEKPFRGQETWLVEDGNYVLIDNYYYPNLKWEDEPIEVNLSEISNDK